MNEDCRAAVRYILARNILCGNALSLKQVDARQRDLPEPIIFSEWSFVGESKLKRRDFRLDELLNDNASQPTLLTTGWEYDQETNAYIPAPIREYPPTYYRRVQDAE